MKNTIYLMGTLCFGFTLLAAKPSLKSFEGTYSCVSTSEANKHKAANTSLAMTVSTVGNSKVKLSWVEPGIGKKSFTSPKLNYMSFGMDMGDSPQGFSMGMYTNSDMGSDAEPNTTIMLNKMSGKAHLTYEQKNKGREYACQKQ